MRVRPIHLLHFAALTLLLATVPSCGSPKEYDWRNRELAWKYGPTNGAARSEHLSATGTKGPGKITEGWKCNLTNGTTLTVRSYNLARSHRLLGKTKLIIGMFEKSGARLKTVTTDTLTSDNSSFTFELTEDITKPIWDLVIWFGKP
ncbi:MAG: hypothetical protein ACI8UD_002461 [Planctomycetota bacterium]|jgi:hypothetical protein